MNRFQFLVTTSGSQWLSPLLLPLLIQRHVIKTGGPWTTEVLVGLKRKEELNPRFLVGCWEADLSPALATGMSSEGSLVR